MRMRGQERERIRRTERGKLLVALVDLARAAPQAARDAHRREDAVIVEQEALERLFDEDEVEVGQARGDGLAGPENESVAREERVSKGGRTRKVGRNSLSVCSVRCRELADMLSVRGDCVSAHASTNTQACTESAWSATYLSAIHFISRVYPATWLYGRKSPASNFAWMTRASRSDREPSFWSAAVRRKRSVLRRSDSPRQHMQARGVAHVLGGGGRTHLLMGLPGTLGPVLLTLSFAPSPAPPVPVPAPGSGGLTVSPVSSLMGRPPICPGCPDGSDEANRGASLSDWRNSLQYVSRYQSAPRPAAHAATCRSAHAPQA